MSKQLHAAPCCHLGKWLILLDFLVSHCEPIFCMCICTFKFLNIGQHFFPFSILSGPKEIQNPCCALDATGSGLPRSLWRSVSTDSQGSESWLFQAVCVALPESERGTHLVLAEHKRRRVSAGVKGKEIRWINFPLFINT